LCVANAAEPEAQPAEKQGADRYNMLVEYDLKASSEVIKKLGAPLRIASHLKACKLDALAEEIEPSTLEQLHAATDYLSNQGVRKDLWPEVMAGVVSSTDMYAIGYAQLSTLEHARDPEKFCQMVTKAANEILRQRKAEKEAASRSAGRATRRAVEPWNRRHQGNSRARGGGHNRARRNVLMVSCSAPRLLAVVEVNDSAARGRRFPLVDTSLSFLHDARALAGGQRR
jgi:hypothetical protein